MYWPKRISIFFLCVAVGCGAETSAAEGTPDDAVIGRPRAKRGAVGATISGLPSSQQRSFEFHYRFNVTGLEPGRIVRAWLPVPTSSTDQTVQPLSYRLPAKPTFHRESKYGNQILYLETLVPRSGELTFDVPYRVDRKEVIGLVPGRGGIVAGELPKVQRERFLQPNANVPISGRPLELLADMELSGDAIELANQIYDVVDQHLTYKKVGTGWGNGDVLWVCDSRYGNCTDFHSLFISLARSQGVPSRFEIGFPIPSDAKRGPVGGYHCWAFFFTPKRGWVPVDISEADKHPSMKEYYFGNLTRDRVTFCVGRDIELVPKCAWGPLNYFIYPHIEVDGAAVARDQIELKFSYADLDP